MLNIDPQLFQPKVIRMQTTQSIGNHLVRTTHFSNSQVMTGTTSHVRVEANNNILAANDEVTTAPYKRRSFHEMDQDTELGGPEMDWTPDQMGWSAGDGDLSDHLYQQSSISTLSFQSTLSSDTSLHSEEPLSEQSREEEIISQLNEARSCSREECSRLLLKMTYSNGNCALMRQCGCLPLLVELLHGHEDNSNAYLGEYLEVRRNASQVLHNIVFAQQRAEDKRARREGRVLRHLQEIRDYADQLLCAQGEVDNRTASFTDQNLIPSVAALMKLSFDEDHRHAMCQLGGVQAIAELLRVDHWAHGVNNDPHCTTLRRYLGMALTNLTFGDGANKALLCSMRPFMEALVAQLYSPSEDLRQVTASVLRNLSWRADPTSKRALREVGAVPLLVRSALRAQKDSALKSVLSALWNLSAHCSANKADICREEGALAFLVSTLTHKSRNRTLAIVENGGGILRNISSHVAIQNEYRAILRRHNCLQILLTHLKSPSLTVVSNACGTLWNLSARNAQDQRALWEMGAVGMLKKLVNSKHKMISMGSSAALKNLLSARPPGAGLCLMDDSAYRGEDAPTLMVRKQKALSTEIDQNLSETYDNTDSPKTSPVKHADQVQTRSRRHISPSAARYLANQRLKTELSLPKNEEVNMSGSYVVEEKHNGAFQVTKNAKQGLNFRQGQQTKLQTQELGLKPAKDGLKTRQDDINQQTRLQMDTKNQDVGLRYTNTESGSKLCFKPSREIPKQHGHPPASQHYSGPDENKVESGSKLCFRPAVPKQTIPPEPSAKHGSRQGRFEKEVPKPVEELARNASRSMSPIGVRKERSSAPDERRNTSDVPKPLHESRIPLPKSSVSRLESQRSQSASPVAQRRCLAKPTVVVPQKQDRPPPVDVTATQPKWAWSEKRSVSPEKVDNAPERPGKTFGEDIGAEDEVRVWRTEDTPSLMSSTNDLAEEEPVGARCSLNIRTSTGVKMIRNHPLLVNAAAYRSEEEGRLFEHRNKDEEFESGKTMEFSVQSDYDIEETLSLMSRSSSVASISSFDQQSLHEDDSFASDLSHRTSGIESPSELSDSPCQTAPTSPLGSSHYVSVGGDASDATQTRSSAPEETELQDNNKIEDAPSEEVHPIPNDVDDDHALSKKPALFEVRSSSSSSFSAEDISPSERAILDECIRAGMPVGQPTYQMLDDASTGRHLPPKEGEYESEEKGKEDERKAEKNRLFRIPESPGRKEDPAEEVTVARKTVLDQMGNRRFEKLHQNRLPVQMIKEAEGVPHQKSGDSLAESPENVAKVTSQLDFLMKSDPKDSDGDLRNRRSASSADKTTNVPNQLEFLMKHSSEASARQKNDEKVAEDAEYFTKKKSVEGSEASPSYKNDAQRTAKTANQLEFLMRESSKDKPTESKSSEDKDKVSGEDEEEDLAEKDIDCSESEELMMTSSLLGEARNIAEAFLLEVNNSTEDMTVSTLSCLSDLDNARPPSAMADLGGLSLEDSFKKSSTPKKTSLLRDLQLGRLGKDSPDNLSLKSSCTSDLLGNVNPPSLLDDISLTSSMGSLEGDSEEKKEVGRTAAQDSLYERMHDAAAMAQLYAKELSALAGDDRAGQEQAGARISLPSAVHEVTIADVTDIGCDTVGSDTEMEEDLPCDDEDTTLKASLTKDDGSSENLTVTLTEDQAPDLSPFFLKPFMTSEEFKALQENADMILNTLKDIEVSDDEDDGGHSNSGDLLEDETMSLVSNESDEECPSPRPRTSNYVTSPTCNGMVGLPQPLKHPHTSSSLPKKSFGPTDLGGFDSRTFTRKRSSVPKEMIPTVQTIKSPTCGPPKGVSSKIASAWKGRSKSADVSRNSKLKMAPHASPLHKEEGGSQRSTPSPKSPLSRSNTLEKLTDEETPPSIRRPSSLALSQKANSPRHAFTARGHAQKPATARTVPPPSSSRAEAAILSPSGNIPKLMNKTSSNIPCRRSMIPTPAKIGLQGEYN